MGSGGWSADQDADEQFWHHGCGHQPERAECRVVWLQHDQAKPGGQMVWVSVAKSGQNRHGHDMVWLMSLLATTEMAMTCFGP